MPAREIVLLGDRILRDRAREVDDFDQSLRDLVRDMFITMATAEGAGLAAPQVGVSIRVLVADVRSEEEEGGGNVAVVMSVGTGGGSAKPAPDKSSSRASRMILFR